MAWLLSALAIIGQIFTISIKLFDLWREKDMARAEAKKGALNDAVSALAKTDIDDVARRRDVSSALFRLRRVR